MYGEVSTRSLLACQTCIITSLVTLISKAIFGVIASSFSGGSAKARAMPHSSPSWPESSSSTSGP